MQTALIVEDNRIIRMMYSAGLAGYGYQVAEAQNMTEARSYLERAGAPKVLVLDLKLPDGNGMEIIRYIREHLGQQDTKIIVASGVEIAAEELYSLGADAFLPKPVELEEILESIQN